MAWETRTVYTVLRRDGSSFTINEGDASAALILAYPENVGATVTPQSVQVWIPDDPAGAGMPGSPAPGRTPPGGGAESISDFVSSLNPAVVAVGGLFLLYWLSRRR